MSAAAPIPQTVCFPPDVAVEGRRLIHQQCFLWGRDIVRPAGNLLSAFGLARVADAEGKGRRYDGRDGSGSRIALWGSGAAYVAGDGRGIHLNRYQFVPRVIVGGVPAAAFFPDDLALRESEADDFAWVRRALKDFCCWVAEYEAWVAATVEPAHRSEALRWPQAVSRPEDVADAWAGLAEAVLRIGE
ncbi:MAG: hypothetical protein ACKVVT_00750 [Dehalococcoidia bacterium]